MPFDVLVVGGGPAGLAASIRLKQLSAEKGKDLSVCLIDKGRYVRTDASRFDFRWTNVEAFAAKSALIYCRGTFLIPRL